MNREVTLEGENHQPNEECAKSICLENVLVDCRLRNRRPGGEEPRTLAAGGAEQEKAGSTNKEIELLNSGDRGIRQGRGSSSTKQLYFN